MIRHTCFAAAFALLACLCAAPAARADDHGGDNQPVKVYILAGQSNMVGIGTVSGGGQRWADEFIDPVVSVYPGQYDPDADYGQMEPIKTMKPEKFGRVSPTPYPKVDGPATYVTRGHIKMPETGVYEFRPGYGGSTVNIMTIDGQEVHRKEPGQKNAQYTHIKLEADEKVPFKIIYLTDQANGLGWYARQDIPGTLHTAARVNGKFPFLVDDDGNWASRDDVYYKGVVTATADKWLSVGCGAGSSKIGPELGFGHVIGDYHDQPVLLLKASQGNRSLGWDFLPPGSERFEHTDDEGTTWIYAGYKDTPSRWKKGTEPEKPSHNWYAGKQYDDCFNAAKEVLANFDQQFPQWEGRGYEIAGFAWWQGHKDGGEQGTGEANPYAERYEHNLVQLINTLRKDFDAPDAPFVVATCGFGGGKYFDQATGTRKPWEPGSSADTIFDAQMNVSDPAQHPQFKGTVASVDTRPFWIPASESPRSQSFHYHQNGVTYLNVGLALGKAMVELKDKE